MQLMQLDRATWWWLWHQKIQTYSCFASRLSALFRHPCMPSVERGPERDMLVFPAVGGELCKCLICMISLVVTE